MSRLVAVLASWCAVAGGSWAQEAPAAAPGHGALTLEEALRYAVDHYPSVRAAVERVNASAADLSVARAAYLPRLDSLWQSSLATTNNVFGQVLPQPVLPALSGPVLPGESSDGVYGSAAGVLFSWQALDFGLRSAGVAGAEAALTQARASAAVTRLEVQGAVGGAFLSLLSAEQAVAAAQADLERRDVLSRTVRALVDSELRPGAEASRADAERAAAHTRLIRAQAGSTVARAELSRLLGFASTDLRLDAAGLLGEAAQPRAIGDPDAHPLAQVREAAVQVAAAQRKAVARGDLPRVEVKSSVFARGSGAHPDGRLDGGTEGLHLDRENWAVGVQLVFPNLFAFASSGARKAGADALQRAAAALHDEALLVIRGEQESAAAMVEAARAIATHTPVQLAAAREGEAQARARYDAGLAGIVEVAEAQSLLADAEYQDRLARVELWRALLAQAVAQGELGPFLDAVRVSAQGR